MGGGVTRVGFVVPGVCRHSAAANALVICFAVDDSARVHSDSRPFQGEFPTSKNEFGSDRPETL